MTEALQFRDLRTRSEKEVLDREFFDRRFRIISDAVNKVAAETEVLKGVSDRLVALGLARIDEYLTPALTRVNEASTLGFLIATSSTAATLAVDDELTFVVDEGPRRGLFTPTPYVAIVRSSVGAHNDFALAEVQTYNATNGGLAVKIVAISGEVDQSDHDDWTIVASAGVYPYIYSRAEQVAADQVTVAADKLTTSGYKDDAEAAAAAAVAAKDLAEAAAEAAETFNPANYYTSGQTDTAISGAVSALINAAPGALDTLDELAAALGDDANFASTVTTALSGKASTSHNHDAAYAALAHTHTLAGITDAGNAAGYNKATVGEVRSATSNKILTADLIASAAAFVSLSDGASIAVDWNSFIVADVTMAGNRTLANPTNVQVGTTRYVLIKGSDGTSRTLSFGANYLGSLPTITDATSTRWYLLTLVAISASHIGVSSLRVYGS